MEANVAVNPRFIVVQPEQETAMQKQPTALLAALALALLLGAAMAQSPLPTGAEKLAPERYPDVPEEHWASDAIRRLSALGVLTGYPDQQFRGSQPASRYELAVVAARLVDLIGGSLAELALDPGFWSEVEDAAAMLGRMRRVERALENAPSIQRVEVLERRIRDLESHLNEVLGEERFPLDPADPTVPSSAADTVPDVQRSGGKRPVAAAAREGGAAGRVDADEVVAGASSGRRRPVEWWLGVAAGYPLPATMHVGLRDLWPSLHLRGGAGFGNDGQFGLELLGLYQLPAAADAPILPYLGAGPLLRGGGEIAAGVLVLGGIEVPLGRELDERGLLYLELGPEVIYRQGVDMGLMARIGLGYRF